MTVFEHAMLGASLGLAAGMQKRYGWRVIGMAAVAGALPDWDGLSILFGPEAYARAHRVWGHNLLVAGGGGVLIAWLEYRFCILTRAAQSVERRLPALILPAASLASPERGKSPSELASWLALGLAAGYSHLLADYFYSGHPNLHTWGLPLLWPFSNQAWARPTVAWGDLGATLLFVAEMFAIYRWPKRARLVAWLALAAVVVYVAVHAPGVDSSIRTGLKAGLQRLAAGRRVFEQAGQGELQFLRRLVSAQSDFRTNSCDQLGAKEFRIGLALLVWERQAGREGSAPGGAAQNAWTVHGSSPSPA